MKEEKKIRNLSNGRPGDGMAMGVTPGTIGGPFCLIIQAGGTSAAEGKLSSHR